MPRKLKASAASPQSLVPAEDMAGEKPTFASDDYNRAARSAKLRSIMLTRSNFYMEPEFIIKREDGEPKLTYASTIGNIIFDESKGVASCEWRWSVTGKTGKKKTLFIEAIYFVAYGELTDCNPEAVSRFLQRVSRFATYPYFRAHVSQVSWESGANLPILPTIST